ncbi:hypothetical protein C3B61_18630 [Cryobacterium zongtaii]|uniref:Uncharacterized protein n=1 Tax=Cryobacterium zongtaii TaxID=1259217 RepID=A0A2S3Z9G9_9MICO|nr:hypothetical protein C3B61_18630 [Cryobacterium zongtaii]
MTYYGESHFCLTLRHVLPTVCINELRVGSALLGFSHAGEPGWWAVVFGVEGEVRFWPSG